MTRHGPTNPYGGQPRIVLWWASVAVWTLLAAGDAVDYFVSWQMAGTPRPVWAAVGASFPGWEAWVVLGPVVFWLGRRIPVTWPTKVGPIAAHLNLSVLIGVVHAMVHSGAGWTFGLRPSTLAFAEYFESTLLDWLPISVLTYWAIIAVTRGLIYYEELREEQVRAATLSRQLSEARLEALSAQLHPHFLFNTLNSAVALIRTEDSLRAVDVLTHLGDILRHLLRAAPSQEISLADELSFLQRYLDIERIRFQHRLTTSLDVPADTMDASVPSLILQPLVENAIHHGLDTHDEAIRIELAAGVAQGVLVLTVRDDGPGLPEGWSERRSTGVGLANVRARLEHLYGSVARLEIRGRPRGGVEAKITMPFIRIVRPDIEPEVVG